MRDQNKCSAAVLGLDSVAGNAVSEGPTETTHSETRRRKRGHIGHGLSCPVSAEASCRLPKSCADIRSIPMLADDWGVPRCEADERGGVVLACLVERLLRVLGIVVSGRAVADTFTNFSAWTTLSRLTSWG